MGKEVRGRSPQAAASEEAIATGKTRSVVGAWGSTGGTPSVGSTMGTGPVLALLAATLSAERRRQ
eukprot:978745-Heterocapsa_arctica.AAC.1